MSERPVLSLYPYLLNGTCWVFDDERTGLKEEAFVMGMTEMISRVVEAKGLHDAEGGVDCRLTAIRGCGGRSSSRRCPHERR